MLKSKSHILWVVLILIGLVSCKTEKAAVKSDTTTTQTKTSLSGAEKVAFDETFFAGLGAKYAGDMKGAASYFQQCLGLDPSNVAVKYELSIAYFGMKYFENAVTMAEEAYAGEPDNTWYAENLAEIYFGTKKYPESAEMYEKLVETYPNELKYYYRLGAAYMNTSNANGAIDIYERLENKIGFDNSVAEQLYELYIYTKQDEKAEAKMAQLIAENPSEIRYIGMMAQFYQDRGETEKAIALYEKLKSERPNDPYVKMALYDYYSKTGDTAMAMTNLKEAFRSEEVKLDDKILILLSLEKRAMGDPSRTAELLELVDILIELEPNNADLWAVKGSVLNNLERKEEARNAFLKSLSYNDNNYPAWNEVLFIDSELNQADSLLKHSLACVELFPAQVLPHYFSGAVYIQQGEYQKGIDALNQAKDLAYGLQELEVQIMSSLGDAYYQVGNFQKAWQSYDASLRMKPSNDYVLNNYAYYLSVQGEQLDKALSMSKRTVDNNPNNAIYLDTYGWIFYKMGDYVNAVKYLEMAVKRDDTHSPEVLEHYGDALYRVGRVDDAVMNWKLAQSYGGDSPELSKKVKEKKIGDAQ